MNARLGPAARAAISIDAAAQALCVSRRSVYAAIARGELRSFKLGGRRLVPMAELERLIETKMNPAPKASEATASVAEAQTGSLELTEVPFSEATHHEGHAAPKQQPRPRLDDLLALVSAQRRYPSG